MYIAPYIKKTVTSIIVSFGVVMVISLLMGKNTLTLFFEDEYLKFALSFYIGLSSFVLSILVLVTAEGIEKYICKKVECKAIMQLYSDYRKKDMSSELNEEEKSNIKSQIEDSLKSHSLPNIVEQKLESCLEELKKEKTNFITVMAFLKKATEAIKEI